MTTEVERKMKGDWYDYCSDCVHKDKSGHDPPCYNCLRGVHSAYQRRKSKV